MPEGEIRDLWISDGRITFSPPAEIEDTESLARRDIALMPTLINIDFR